MADPIIVSSISKAVESLFGVVQTALQTRLISTKSFFDRIAASLPRFQDTNGAFYDKQRSNTMLMVYILFGLIALVLVVFAVIGLRKK